MKGLDLFVVEAPIDIYYLTGAEVTAGQLWIGPKSATLYVDTRYYSALKGKIAVGVKKDTSKENRGKKIGFDSGSTSYQRALELRKFFAGASVKGMEGLIDRSIKDKTEIKFLEKSAALLWKGFVHTRKMLKVGITEKELAWEFESYCRKKGAERLSFDPIMAFGPNSAYPHHHPTDRKLKKGDLVLMDMGVELGRYASDMTRIVFFGEVPARLKKIYRVVRGAHAAAVALCKPGTEIAELDRAARRVMRKEKCEKLYLHSLGHGIGIDVHESPRIHKGVKGEVLEEGMVITIEPGLYIEGLGGVRYEDTLVITSKGHRNFFEDTAP